MVPLIRSRQPVIVAPVDPAKVEVGDIVLAKVAGTVYLHLVSAVDAGRVQTSNNRGRVNGWTNHARIYRICVAVEGCRAPDHRQALNDRGRVPTLDGQTHDVAPDVPTPVLVGYFLS